jgi:mycothiol system anti-sigma-R factor
MKGCGGYSDSIQLYLDKELSGRDLLEFRAHLEQCAACREELEAEENLSRLLHRSRPLYFAPDALKDRILEAIGEPASEPLLGVRPKRERS